MERGFGQPVATVRGAEARRQPVRYLVIIEGGGTMLAQLFLATRERVEEIDASTEEVAVMTRGLTPARGAGGPEWDVALAGHSAAERAAARVYTLDL